VLSQTVMAQWERDLESRISPIETLKDFPRSIRKLSHPLFAKVDCK
jgi:hypothetical protein